MKSILKRVLPLLAACLCLTLTLAACASTGSNPKADAMREAVGSGSAHSNFNVLRIVFAVVIIVAIYAVVMRLVNTRKFTPALLDRICRAAADMMVEGRAVGTVGQSTGQGYIRNYGPNAGGNAAGNFTTVDFHSSSQTDIVYKKDAYKVNAKYRRLHEIMTAGAEQFQAYLYDRNFFDNNGYIHATINELAVAFIDFVGEIGMLDVNGNLIEAKVD